MGCVASVASNQRSVGADMWRSPGEFPSMAVALENASEPMNSVSSSLVFLPSPPSPVFDLVLSVAHQSIEDDPQGTGGAFSVGADVTLTIQDTFVRASFAGQKVGFTLHRRLFVESRDPTSRPSLGVPLPPPSPCDASGMKGWGGSVAACGVGCLQLPGRGSGKGCRRV